MLNILFYIFDISIIIKYLFFISNLIFKNISLIKIINYSISIQLINYVKINLALGCFFLNEPLMYIEIIIYMFLIFIILFSI